MFSRAGGWKRDLGFRAQVASRPVILLSSEVAERDCLTYYLGARGRTCVARFAVPVDSWPDVDSSWARLRAEGRSEDFVFLRNQLWQHKNHMLAVEAAALLAQRGSSRVILVTGHGEDPRRPGYRAEIEARITALGAGSHIWLLGSVDHGLVQAMMMGCNALMNPSRFEGWCTTVEEAKAVGTPMLLSDIPVHREQAPHAGFFGTDDAAAMADAIASASPRPLGAIRAAADEARKVTLQRQSDYAQTVSRAVRHAATSSANWPD